MLHAGPQGPLPPAAWIGLWAEGQLLSPRLVTPAPREASALPCPR